MKKTIAYILVLIGLLLFYYGYSLKVDRKIGVGGISYAYPLFSGIIIAMIGAGILGIEFSK